jgi:flagellar L-ring protein precursor FlgH
MFADKKAQAVGDILTIVVNENAVAQSTVSKTSNRDSSINDSVAQFIYPPALSGLGTHGGQLPSTQITGKAAYSGRPSPPRPRWSSPMCCRTATW